MTKKTNVLIQPAIDVEYACNFEHMVFVNGSPEAWKIFQGIDFFYQNQVNFIIWETSC